MKAKLMFAMLFAVCGSGVPAHKAPKYPALATLDGETPSSYDLVPA